MVAWLFLRDLWPTTPLWVIVTFAPALIVVKVGLNWTVGWWWDKHDVFDKEQTWLNKRDPVAKVLSSKILDNEGIEGGF